MLACPDSCGRGNSQAWEARIPVYSKGWQPLASRLAALGWKIAATALLLVNAQALEFTSGAWQLTFNDGDGALQRIACGGQEVVAGGPGPAISFSIGPTNKIVALEKMNLPRKLLKQARPAPDTLELTIAAGSFEWMERYRAFADQPRLDRSLRLINRGTETVKLRGVKFTTPGVKAAGAGFYRFPGVWPAANHRFAELQAGRVQRGRGSLAPVLAQLSNGKTLAWTSFAEDSPWVDVAEGTGAIDVRQGLNAAGYLRPNQPQDFSFVTLQVLDGDYWAALAQLDRWMDAVGLKIPADRPAWVTEAIFYAFHPGGTTGGGWKDLGGFQAATDRLLPTLPRLGVNAAWILPVEFKGAYWPMDYYRFADGLGDGAQFRALVAKAHALGFRVWQDLVPHGGAPEAVHNKAHPEFMLQLEDGSHLNYWLNDFALPSWQHYIADVATYYVKEYGVDGYRVDACSGSKENNWNPAVPYARASLAKMWGGLEMLRGIRAAVRKANPQYGAILGEVESTRHEAVTDAVYDFGFCYNLCRQWNVLDAGPYVSALQAYLEEQKLSEPRGVLRLRHVESHDSLRAQGWYGVRGMHAMYALSAWIDGIPMIYQGMEDGHGYALAEINRIRRERPELARGEAFYRAVQCDVPGVFTCLRKLGDRTSVVVVNFNREPVQAQLGWPGGKASLALSALEYTVLPKADVRDAAKPTASAAGAPQTITLLATVACTGAEAWFADTIEGRLYDAFLGTRGNGLLASGRIYWRPQGGGALWQHQLTPLHPTATRLGYKTRDGLWHIYEFSGAITNELRIGERAGELTGLHLLGAEGLTARVSTAQQLPPEPDVAAGLALGGVTLRVVGAELIVSNAHYTVQLHRQGGVIRQLRTGANVLAEGQDIYGDQEYFAIRDSSRVNAASDVESAVRLWTADDGLHLRFEGQLRGDQRFALMRYPVSYRTEYVFSAAAQFKQSWALSSEKEIKGKKAFLAMIIRRTDADRFRFERDGRVVSEGQMESASGRRGLTKEAPDTVRLSREGKPLWSLSGVQTPAGADCQCFVSGRQFFITLLDGKAPTMQAKRWYEFQTTWSVK
jgi:glycosidase